MAIRKSTAFTASDGSLCATLEEAQRHELAVLWLAARPPVEGTTEEDRDADRTVAIEFAHFVQANADAILEILTTGPRSRPSTRAKKGTTNPKRAAVKAALTRSDGTPFDKPLGAARATPEQAKAGFAAARAAADRHVGEDIAATSGSMEAVKA